MKPKKWQSKWFVVPLFSLKEPQSKKCIDEWEKTSILRIEGPPLQKFIPTV
jgi:hypothetical protein